MCSFVCLSLLGRGESKFDDAKTTFVIALPYFLNLMPPAFNSNLALWTSVCLNFAVYSSLLLLKKSFYAFFLTAVYLDFIPLVHYTTDKRLGGGVSTTSPPRPGVYLGPGVKSRKYST